MRALSSKRNKPKMYSILKLDKCFRNLIKTYLSALVRVWAEMKIKVVEIQAKLVRI